MVYRFARKIGIGSLVLSRGALSGLVILLCVLASIASLPIRGSGEPRIAASPSPPYVIALQVVSARKAAHLLAGVFPRASIRVDSHSNAIIIRDSIDDPNVVHAVVAGIDVKDPMSATVTAVQLHTLSSRDAEKRLEPLFRSAKFTAGTKQTLIVVASPVDLAQIQALITAIDAPPASPTPKPQLPTAAIRVSQRDPRRIARALSSGLHNLRVGVSGNAILVSGSPEDIAQAKNLVADLDQPEPWVQYTRVYRLRNIQAASFANLIDRSFRGVDVKVDADLNALTVFAATAQQQRIADSIAQMDQAPSEAGPPIGAQGVQSFGQNAAGTEVVLLHAAVPAAGGGASTSPAEVAQSVLQSLSTLAPDLKIIVHPNSTKLILAGSSRSIELAKALIAKLDVAEPLVELDTEVLEVDEGVQKQLGFKFPTPVLSTTYSELQPGADATTGVSGQLLRLQPLTRTPLTLAGELDFLISTNKAKILEDPRITTFSGRTASLHAGETVNILTTTGGGTGTVATTQVQSFQTGVTLDITPVVNTDDYVTVTLHPSINSEAGISAAGLPNIQTRDTTTTIGLHDGETIVVGGLIEDDDTRTVSKIPILGDLPLIGRLFQDVGVSHTRNELIVTVTPHIVRPGASPLRPPQSRLAPPTAAPLPTPVSYATVMPSATLPPMSSGGHSAQIARVSPTDASGPNAPNSASEPGPATTSSPPTPPSPVSSAPGPLPSAFGQTNTYTFGTAPQNNYADPSQPPQIFFVQIQPTVVKEGQTVTLSAITTTNVSSLSFGPSVTSPQVTLASISPGKWQSTITFSASGLPSTSGNVFEFLTAKTQLGASTSMKVPFSLLEN